MRRHTRSRSDADSLIRPGIGLVILVVSGVGAVIHFAKATSYPPPGALFVVLGLAAMGALGYVTLQLLRRRATATADGPQAAEGFNSVTSTDTDTTSAVQFDASTRPGLPSVRSGTTTAAPAQVREIWTVPRIRRRLDEIDWYQFEKFCAALLAADDFVVERRGGAQPDGGVDLIVEKQGVRALIQCKHWRTWVIQEKVVREMLGSMTHFGVTQGAIYTLKGWTQPALGFAEQHAITLVNGNELALSALQQFTSERLAELLNSTDHRCPKCEAPMIWRQGNFTPFWGCSRYPACQGKLNHSGAK